MGRRTVSTAVAGTSFPQVNSNREFSEIKQNIAQYSGGQDVDDILGLAGIATNEAIRQYDMVNWRFNILSQDITLVADTQTYAMAATIRRPIRAQLVDSNDATREAVTWVPWEEWKTFVPDQTHVGNRPFHYTIENLHETGLVSVDPTPGSDISYPTLRLFYVRRIALLTNDTDKMAVPIDVEEAIVALAVKQFLQKKRSFSEARDARTEARFLRAEVEREWRIWEDPPLWDG